MALLARPLRVEIGGLRGELLLRRRSRCACVRPLVLVVTSVAKARGVHLQVRRNPRPGGDVFAVLLRLGMCIPRMVPDRFTYAMYFHLRPTYVTIASEGE